MRQILSRREVRIDHWRYPDEAGGGPQVTTLAGLLAATEAGTLAAAEWGVRLGPADDVALLAPHVGRLALIVVHFQASSDGRGYTQGQLLRQRHGYRGELRAAGAIGRDHLFLLARCGFDAFDFDSREDPQAALAHLERYSVAYQGAAGTLVRPRERP